MKKAKVFWTDLHTTLDINLPQKLEKLMKAAGFESIDFKDKFTAVKLHFGEPGNLAFLRPNYAKVVCDYVKRLGGKPFVTDCNTLYVGGRKNALDHLDSAYENGYNPFSTGVHTIIADGLKGTEERLVPVENGEYIKEAKIGAAIMDADIIISLAHFKGHEAAGFGGALKNLGMGCGSRAGKMEMHCASKPQVSQELCIGCGRCKKICAHDAPSITNGKAAIDQDKCVGCGRCVGVCPRDAIEPLYDEANDVLNYKIAEYSKAVVQGRPNFHINMVIDVSPFCDCHAENDIPIVSDIGMFASFDPVALDMACADAVNAQPPVSGSLLEKSKHTHHDHFTDVSPETNWKSALEHGEKIGLGTMQYELKKI
jgi:uncharacterized Fe-S center protein